MPRQASIAYLVPAAALFVAAACADDDRPPPATPTAPAGATAQPTPSPTPAPADARLAETLRYRGDFEDAINVYGAVAERAAGEEQQAARLAQAQLLSRTGRFEEARASLEAYLAAAGPAGDGTPARYMLASVLDELGDVPGAIAGYDAYIAGGGAATAFARVERAKLLATLARAVEAEQEAEVVLASDLLPAFKASFIFSMGSAFERGGIDANALAWYSRAASAPGGDEASALARIGGIKQRLGDPTWPADYQRAIAFYPASGVAGDLLAALDEAGVPVSEYVRGLVHYRASRDALARPALVAAVAAGDRPAEATYYLAAIAEREGDLAGAVELYRNAQRLDPDSLLADDALWWRARLLETTGRYEEAAADYALLASRYPGSGRAADASFRAGLVAYRRGDYAAAAFAWAAPAAAADEDVALRARFWRGLALKRSGAPDGAAELQRLISDAPGNFYALRAEVVLGKNDGRDRTPDFKPGASDWKKIERYVADNVPPTTALALSPLDDRRWALGAELETVGLVAQSGAVFQSLLEDYKDDAPALVEIARRFHEDGRTDLAARAATTLVLAMPDGAREPPEDLLRVAYPLAYGDLVRDAAKDEDLSSMLLLALVRQESFYDPDAGSGAGALGLTQVIPSTGESIAATLGVGEFSAADLYRPRLSLRFGASYLSTQIEDFEENAYYALAAYNGGPGTAQRAAESSGGDIDLFVEDIEFDETRLYVRLVMEHYARYRDLYEKLGRPSLPD